MYFEKEKKMKKLLVSLLVLLAIITQANSSEDRSNLVEESNKRFSVYDDKFENQRYRIDIKYQEFTDTLLYFVEIYKVNKDAEYIAILKNKYKLDFNESKKASMDIVWGSFNGQNDDEDFRILDGETGSFILRFKSLDHKFEYHLYFEHNKQIDRFILSKTYLIQYKFYRSLVLGDSYRGEIKTVHLLHSDKLKSLNLDGFDLNMAFDYLFTIDIDQQESQNYRFEELQNLKYR